MKLSILSDLHLECGGFEPAAVSADVTILAGDIWTRERGIRWAAKNFAPDRTIYLAGNHEFYMEGFEDVLEACRSESAATGVHFLENRSVILDGIRFIGTTLWSDFCLHGEDGDRNVAMAAASRWIDDFKMIFWPEEKGKLRPFEVSDSVYLHRRAFRYLGHQLHKPFPGPTVVITHFLPHPRSIAPRYRESPLNPYFCADLSVLIEQTQPTLWIHGHSHESCDYRVGATRVISNPRGYAPDEINPAFDPELVVEI